MVYARALLDFCHHDSRHTLACGTQRTTLLRSLLNGPLQDCPFVVLKFFDPLKQAAAVGVIGVMSQSDSSLESS
jgi:hypothetical protein